MGLADMFMKMGIEYGSEESLKLSDTIADRLRNTAILESSILAFENGSFPKYDYKSLEKSQYFQELDDLTKSVVQKYGLRNSQILTIAPTGSISTMWGISGGIEPIFATHFDRKTESLHGKDVVYRVYTPIIKEFMENGGEMDNEIVVTSHNLHWGKRIEMQSVWQEHLDASISSTVNLPNESTVGDVEKLFEMAWLLGLKGVTIFRDGCKRAGILTLPDSEPEIEPETELECDT